MPNEIIKVKIFPVKILDQATQTWIVNTEIEAQINAFVISIPKKDVLQMSATDEYFMLLYLEDV
jgi:hypothetical protein